MHIFITGGTGLIGRRLCRHWSAAGHRLTVLSRRPERVAELCGREVRGVSSFEAVGDEQVDAVVNLAGEPIAERPWTARRKALLWDSRVRLTERLVEWLEGRSQRPSVLISGSAVGWYGDAGERPLDEGSAAAGEDFASELCLAWEQIAMQAEGLGIRVVRLRTGLVLAPEGGFLARLLPAFRFGLGGQLGNGRQWMSWVHIEDMIGLIDFLLQLSDASGPYNACAPQPVRNRDFTRALGQALRRPTLLGVPAFALRTLLGELSLLLLGGQRVEPRRLLEAGFVFRYNDLPAALADVLAHRPAAAAHRH
ncbi:MULTISPECIES: TIGR01777 family oxidoreductase [unclassified Pseudomonas]|uniref:TIGR01777 family oxidoreductase n=1 Tax=unclassified Pseudomonas TaxID=196821 RepID=UPI0002A1B827|nr:MULTISPECIES: TIGR01777 family oxidoreductase [unclassified Pseudomonas]MBB1605868.1 TIGR01777 family protein [Pseudomonas sp. UMC76]MBB1639085.1 TIGR01777 family protein [Pseudomonas sp. UME83]NTX89034.1 TIGR01777 family protein [Pseudomonas sp. UMA643]NTY17722.1 TIGR01777 family protein [Pseudomonas sp. UMC3103]NTY25048.1 TIGR01777 family protein [Pseudomonas sp. UMA603]